MKTARELTDIVASLSPAPDRTQYHGVSDHVWHAQKFRFGGDGPDSFVITLGTANVLSPKWVFYHNGIPEEGTALPGWFKLENQAGLENAPFADPRRQRERQNRIYVSILEFMTSNSNAVLCLQECWPELETRLHDAQLNCCYNIFSQQTGKESYSLTLVSQALPHELQPSSRAHGVVAVSLYGGAILVNNVHMSFSTQTSVAIVDECLYDAAAAASRWNAAAASSWNFIVGDFNVQTQPLSEEVRTEGECTDTLVEFAARFRQPLFAVHPSGWTIWNVRMNCAEREKNWDHFDNIMLLRATPDVPIPTVEPVDWDCTMS